MIEIIRKFVKNEDPRTMHFIVRAEDAEFVSMIPIFQHPDLPQLHEPFFGAIGHCVDVRVTQTGPRRGEAICQFELG